MTDLSPSLSPEIQAYYNRGREAGRLTGGLGLLERTRTEELLARYLPPPPATVLDVGGGAGVYGCWLAQCGYSVHLIDPMPLHVEQARQASQQQPECPLARVSLGDARHLDYPDGSVDAVLLLGPLYHLTAREERLQAWREAGRVLRGGGMALGAAISRFASAMDGLFSGFLDDPAFAAIVQQDLLDGQHRNPNNIPHYFTTAYLHHPEELRAEVDEAGLRWIATLAVEGFAILLPDADFEQRWRDPARRQQLLDVVRALEAEPTLLGATGHLLAVGHKAE